MLGLTSYSNNKQSFCSILMIKELSHFLYLIKKREEERVVSFSFSQGMPEYPSFKQYIDGKHNEAVDTRSRDGQASLHLPAESLRLNHEMHQQANIGSHFEISSNTDRSGCKIDELFMMA